MNELNQSILLHLLTALCAGGLIGLERSYQGRPAGFRTMCWFASRPAC